MAKKEDDRELLDTAFERYRRAADAESEVREAAIEDFEFRHGQQWLKAVEDYRKAQGLPILTTNRIPRTISMVTNEQRQQRPSVQVNPVGDDADKDVADILQGTIRHIEVNSDAEIARDTAFDHMVTGGFGFWRILTDYVGKSFEQEIFIRPVENPFAVFSDPGASLLDHTTATWRFVVDDIPRESFKAQFPGSELESLDFQATGNAPPEWVAKENVRIAEYFYVEQTPSRLYLLGDGSITEQKPSDKGMIAQERDFILRKVKWVKINAVEVLRRREWPGQWIPIIPVYGDASKINGKLHIAGLVRDAKDPQRAYNYWISRAAEACQIAPKAPYVAAAGQVEDFKAMWERANVDNQAVLIYNPVEIHGILVPPPQRNVAEPPIQAMAEMIRQSDNDFKVATGVYDASLGKQGPDQSGKAVLARQKQTDISTLNFSDNLARSIRYEAKCLVDLIPKVYPKSKLQRIIKPDQSVEHVQITNSSGDTPEASVQ